MQLSHEKMDYGGIYLVQFDPVYRTISYVPDLGNSKKKSRYFRISLPYHTFAFRYSNFNNQYSLIPFLFFQKQPKQEEWFLSYMPNCFCPTSQICISTKNYVAPKTLNDKTILNLINLYWNNRFNDAWEGALKEYIRRWDAKLILRNKFVNYLECLENLSKNQYFWKDRDFLRSTTNINNLESFRMDTQDWINSSNGISIHFNA